MGLSMDKKDLFGEDDSIDMGAETGARNIEDAIGDLITESEDVAEKSKHFADGVSDEFKNKVIHDIESTNAEGDGAKGAKRIPLAGLIGGCIASLAIGIAIGHFFLGGISSLGGKTTLTEGELGTTIATYSSKSGSGTITAKDIFENSGTLVSSKQADGTYKVPSADDALAYARNLILGDEVKKAGIEVSDEEISAYAKENLGSDNFADIAKQYSMEEATVKSIVSNAVGVQKLRDKILEGSDMPKEPEAPTKPENGDEQTANADYYKYIVGLMGDEWDSDKGTWAKQDGSYYAALKEFTEKGSLKKDSATYEAAVQAYYVAYQNYATKAQEVQSKWSDYVNDLLANSTISIATLAS